MGLSVVLVLCCNDHNRYVVYRARTSTCIAHVYTLQGVTSLCSCYKSSTNSLGSLGVASSAYDAVVPPPQR